LYAGFDISISKKHYGKEKYRNNTKKPIRKQYIYLRSKSAIYTKKHHITSYIKYILEKKEDIYTSVQASLKYKKNSGI